MGNLFSKSEELPITLYVSTFQEKGKDTALQIRSRISEKQLMKKVLSAAYHGKQIKFFLSFKDKAQALNSLQQHGLILRINNKKGETEYKFVD